MAEDDDKENKTEEPTHKRLEEAREKGQIPNSKEVNSFFLLFALMIILTVLVPPMARDLSKILLPFIARPEDFTLEMNPLHKLFVEVSTRVALLLSIPLLVAVLAVLASGGLQTKFNISFEGIKPKLEKISPLKGFGRMFSVRSAVDLLKGIAKLIVVGMVAYLAIKPQLPAMQRLPDMEMSEILAMTLGLAKKMLVGILSAMFVIAAADYIFQRKELMKNLRMSKQEIRDEYKQQEGDPHIKGKLKQLRAEKSRKRMMAQVPNADVVITNPTHFAVALKYEAGVMAAPKVLAKGADKAAQRIKEIANEHKIPVLRNPPLARALYATAEIDEEIPLEHYQAVAQVIGYVYKLKRKMPMTLNMPGKKK